MKKFQSIKKHNPGRRSILAAAGLCTLSAVPARLLAQQALSVTPLRENIHLLEGAGANVIVATGEDSVLVVDGGSQAYSDQLLREIDTLGQGRPVAALFNTNWRPEHCGLNHVLGPAGVPIIAHENTRLWQNNDFTVDWEGYHHTPLPSPAQASRTFYKTGSITLDGETVAYGRIGQCHTDGDMYVHFQESNVLIVGDMLAVSTYPLLDYVTGGWIGGAQEATAGLLEMANDETLVIPAYGDARGRSALELQQQMLDHAFEKVSEAFRTGRSLEQFKASAPMAEYDGRYGDPDLFTTLLYRGTWYHVTSRAVRGII